jgi:hypothetical protein
VQIVCSVIPEGKVAELEPAECNGCTSVASNHGGIPLTASCDPYWGHGHPSGRRAEGAVLDGESADRSISKVTAMRVVVRRVFVKSSILDLCRNYRPVAAPNR